MIEFFLRLFRPTVDDVLAQFTKTANKLREVSEREAYAGRAKDDLASELRQQASAHYAEANRAAATSSRIQQLIA